MSLTPKPIYAITIRLTPKQAAEVRSFAAGDDERQSAVVRRLVRLGLERSREQRSRDGNEGA